MKSNKRCYNVEQLRIAILSILKRRYGVKARLSSTVFNIADYLLIARAFDVVLFITNENHVNFTGKDIDEVLHWLISELKKEGRFKEPSRKDGLERRLELEL